MSPAGEQARRARSFEHTYLDSYVAHAPMETHSAVAAVEDGKVTVWAGTQTPFPLKYAGHAGAEAPAPSKVRVITPYVGGGFGGKSASRQAVEAARLATLAGKPVRVVLEPRGGVLLRHVPARRGDQDPVGPRRRRRDRVLGLPGLRRRRSRRRAVLRHPAPPHRGLRRRGAAQARPASTRSPSGRGARRAPTPTRSRASRTSTSWRRRPASTRWSSG